jgi:phosphohistidine phosphatase SixA
MGVHRLRSLFMALALILVSVAVGSAQEASTVGQPAEPSLVDRLRQGGFVIYFRHTSTDFSQADSDLVNLDNCSTQRNLTEVGRAQATAIGEAMRLLAVPIGDVLSSQFCRTLETAWLAFGRATPTRDLTSISGLTIAERDRRLEALRILLATPPPEATNTILVAHQFNLRDAMGVTLITEGEAAIYQPDGIGWTNLVTLVQPNQWAELVPAV